MHVVNLVYTLIDYCILSNTYSDCYLKYVHSVRNIFAGKIELDLINKNSLEKLNILT